MKRRITGAALFGLGLLCLVFAAALTWLIVPMERKVPFDMQPPDVVVVAPQATFLQAKLEPGKGPSVSIQTADLRATTGIKPDFKTAAALTGKLANHTLIWNVYQATDRADTDEPINRSESHIALDNVSGAAVPWSGECYVDVKVTDTTSDQGCSPGNIHYSGQLYLFPFGTQKKTYQYFDGTLEKALPMQYRGEEKYNGVPAYRFEQDVPTQDLPSDPPTVSALLGFLAPQAKTGTMTYQATRTLWVEPETGAIVGYREQQHRELVPDVGGPVTLIDATFQYDDATAKAIKDQAVQGRTLILLLGRWIPLALLVLGLIALFFGFLITRRAAAAAPPAVDDVPEPQHTPAHQA
jgi:hypothetical protein